MENKELKANVPLNDDELKEVSGGRLGDEMFTKCEKCGSDNLKQYDCRRVGGMDKVFPDSRTSTEPIYWFQCQSCGRSQGAVGARIREYEKNYWGK